MNPRKSHEFMIIGFKPPMRDKGLSREEYQAYVDDCLFMHVVRQRGMMASKFGHVNVGIDKPIERRSYAKNEAYGRSFTGIRSTDFVEKRKEGTKTEPAQVIFMTSKKSLEETGKDYGLDNDIILRRLAAGWSVNARLFEMRPRLPKAKHIRPKLPKKD